jgi:DNA-directed RNA polymerase subunit RPC12/RpoP
MAHVALSGFRCERCSHEWLPRDKDQPPRVCPKCKSPYWDKPRKRRVKAFKKNASRAPNTNRPKAKIGTSK